MGSMAMSTFMMFVPWKVQFTFLLILCLGLSYLESKSRGKVWFPLRWLRRITSLKIPARRDQTSRNKFDHIASIGPDQRRHLSQLESLRNAGLLTEREYRRKRNDILNKR